MGCSNSTLGCRTQESLSFLAPLMMMLKLASIMKEFTAVVACLPSGTASQGDLKLIWKSGHHHALRALRYREFVYVGISIKSLFVLSCP